MKLSGSNIFLENETISALLNTTTAEPPAGNLTSNEENALYPISLLIPITVIYVIIFFTGLIGNVSTCIVICRNKSMHTATNYYLFSLAISDLLLLVSGLPPETYRIWSPETYVFGEAFCVLQSFAAETSANATVLTITAFTIERYLAICHPFLSHTMSKLSRAIKYVIVIWIAALCLAAPQAIQFGVEYTLIENGEQRSRCTVVSTQFYFQHAFEISTFVFFVGPMTLITVLYVLIAVKLQRARSLSIRRRNEDGNCGENNEEISTHRSSRNMSAQKRVIKMLVAVVVAFFVCWAPFHAQRLLAVYLSSASPEDQEAFVKFYIVLMYTSGILYFVSTTINPLLYNIMSKKFREAFKATFAQICRGDSRKDRYSSLARSGQSFKTTNVVPMTGKAATNGYFRQRHYSGASQTTVLSNLSKSISVDQNEKRQLGRQLGRSISTVQDHEKFANKHSLLSYGMFKIFGKNPEAQNNNFARQGSVQSGHSANTISNSSLQHTEHNEFNCTELVQYMDDINSDLAT